MEDHFVWFVTLHTKHLLICDFQDVSTELRILLELDYFLLVHEGHPGVQIDNMIGILKQYGEDAPLHFVQIVAEMVINLVFGVS